MGFEGVKVHFAQAKAAVAGSCWLGSEPRNPLKAGKSLNEPSQAEMLCAAIVAKSGRCTDWKNVKL
jgi:hypothetical protein